MRGCAGWSAHELFATPEDRFSHAEAKINAELMKIVSWKWIQALIWWQPQC